MLATGLATHDTTRRVRGFALSGPGCDGVVARDEDAALRANSASTNAPPKETVEVTRVAYVAFTRAVGRR
jgi:hypothetical protein